MRGQRCVGPADVPLLDGQQADARQAAALPAAGHLPAGVAVDVADQLRIKRGHLQRLQLQRRTERSTHQVQPAPMQAHIGGIDQMLQTRKARRRQGQPLHRHHGASQQVRAELTLEADRHAGSALQCGLQRLAEIAPLQSPRWRPRRWPVPPRWPRRARHLPPCAVLGGPSADGGLSVIGFTRISYAEGRRPASAGPVLSVGSKGFSSCRRTPWRHSGSWSWHRRPRRRTSRRPPCSRLRAWPRCASTLASPICWPILASARALASTALASLTHTSLALPDWSSHFSLATA